MYHWIAFIGAQAVSEIPYLVICATLYFACWYFTAGFPVDSSISGHMYLQMICKCPTEPCQTVTDNRSLRIPVHLHRSGHCRVRTERILRRDHEPGPDRRRSDQFLRCGGAVLANAALLAVLAILPGPLHIPGWWSVRRNPLGRQSALPAVGMGEVRRTSGPDMRRVYGRLPF